METGRHSPPPARPAIPLDPITATLDACASHTVVALGEGDHGNEQAHAFRLALIRDPRFATIVNDIVVEVGNARYQDLIDRFLQLNCPRRCVAAGMGEHDPQPHWVCDLPIYQDFFRAVRAVNGSLPPERRLHVLLG